MNVGEDCYQSKTATGRDPQDILLVVSILPAKNNIRSFHGPDSNEALIPPVDNENPRVRNSRKLAYALRRYTRSATISSSTGCFWSSSFCDRRQHARLKNVAGQMESSCTRPNSLKSTMLASLSTRADGFVHADTRKPIKPLRCVRCFPTPDLGRLSDMSLQPHIVLSVSHDGGPCDRATLWFISRHDLVGSLRVCDLSVWLPQSPSRVRPLGRCTSCTDPTGQSLALWTKSASHAIEVRHAGLGWR